MGTNSAIEWTHHTWNPWQGCTKVSPGCKHCYMYRQMKQYGRDATVVRRSADATFNLPLRTKKWGAGDKVFVCSWSDFCHEAADVWRPDSWDIMRTRNDVTYQILTKRPERLAECLPSDWGDGWDNVWLMTSAENQEMLDLRWPHLARVPAKVRGLSLEPLLGPIYFSQTRALRGFFFPDGSNSPIQKAMADWVIVGGESGPNARPMHPDWARDIRDQCAAAQVPFFFKQWGEWAEANAAGLPQSIQTTGHGVISRDGRFVLDTDIACPQEGRVFVYRVGKRRAGALIDGREYREFPEAA